MPPRLVVGFFPLTLDQRDSGDHVRFDLYFLVSPVTSGGADQPPKIRI
ncbi:MAG: hypothetical protein WCG81_08440 [Candidatus Angelobacter sp.]